MNRSVEQKLLDLYVANVEIIGEGFPARVNARRREFIEAFNLCSLPDASDERYRFSDIRGLFGGRDWEHYFIPPVLHCHGCENLVCEGMPTGHHTIRLYNGFSDGALTELENGVMYGSLRAAAGAYPDLFEQYYNSVADNKSESVTALNSAFSQDGSFLYLPEGVELDEPVFIHHKYLAPSEDVMCFGRTLLIFGARSKAHVQFVHYTCREIKGSAYLADYVREVVLEEEADVRITETSFFRRNDHLILNSYIRQESGSRCESHLLDIGEGSARFNLTTDLAGPHAESSLYGLYLHGKQEKCDIDLRINHFAPDCRSYELLKGVASGESLGAFAGMVYVAPDAQRTNGFQQNRNLLLSDSARIFTKPQLEIYADDVKCSHGATVGQLDDDAVYYMRQRGIGEEDARRLQLHGFVYDVLAHCTDEKFRTWMTGLAQKKIEKI